MNAEEKIKEINDKIEELEIEICKLNREKDNLYKENAQFFIGNIYVGDGDYWDEYLYPIGFTIESKAREWAEKKNPEQDIDEWWGTMPAYFSVSKEEFRLYGKWKHFRKIELEVSAGDIGDPICSLIKEEIMKIKKELGIDCNYIHIGICDDC